MPKTEKTIDRPLNENEFELPIGIEINGEFHKTVTLKEMTGEVDEALGDPKVRDNIGKIQTEAIYGVLEKIGNTEKFKKEDVRNMFTADRDFILAMNHKVSLGDKVEYTHQCPNCGGRNDVTAELDKLPVTYLEQHEPREVSLELPSGVKDAEGNVYKKIKLSLPTGFVQEQVFPIVVQNPRQAETQMLAMTTEHIEGLSHWNPDTFRKMTKKDRKFISEKLAEVQLGIDLSPTVTCVSCGQKSDATIPFTTLLGE